MIYKIIITGPVGSGKTTAIRALTDKKSLETDAPVSDATSQRKQTTTVALDYGVIKLNDDDVVHVYGTPGQERFDFMWEILSEGANGMVLLLDNSRNYPFRDLIYYANHFQGLIKTVPVIIGITQTDVEPLPPIESYREWVKELNLDAEVMIVDARNKGHMQKLIIALLKQSVLGVKRKRVDAANEDENIQSTKSTDTINNVLIEEKRKEKRKEKSERVPVDATIASGKTYGSIVTTASSASAKILLSEKSMAAVAKIQGVTGVSLTNDMGELIDSTVEDDDLNEFIAFLSGITPAIQEKANLGKIHRIMLRGVDTDNLTVFVEDEQSLGVTSLQRTSVPALSQQIEDMLQWI